MRICVAHPSLGPGDGSSRYIADVVGLLCELGHAVILACGDVQIELDKRVHALDPHGEERFDVLLGSDLNWLRELAACAERIVYAPLGMLAWLERPAERAPLRALEAWALDRCDGLLRFTERGVQVLEQEYGVSLRSKSHIAVYLSDARSTPDVPALSRPQPPTLLWVGRLTETKNVAFLLRAAAALASPTWRLELCGQGPCRNDLAASVERLGIADRVHLRGYVPNLDAAYARASLFLTASRAEHYSLTLMEAYARGTPCIGLRPDQRTIFNACDDQIEDGRTGYLVQTPDEMAHRIDLLLSDEALRQTLGHTGWARRRELVADDAFRLALANAVLA